MQLHETKAPIHWVLELKLLVAVVEYIGKPKGSKYQYSTYGLHCSSFSGLPYRILTIYLAKSKKGTTMETIGPIGMFLVDMWDTKYMLYC